MTTFEWSVLGLLSLIALAFIAGLFWKRKTPVPIETDDEGGEGVLVRTYLYYLVIGIFYALAFGAGWFFYKTEGWESAMIWLAIIALYTLLSIRTVPVEYLSAVTFFEIPVLRPKRKTQLFIVLRGLMRLLKGTRATQEKDIPAEPNKIWKAGDETYGETQRLAGFVKPLRVATGPEKPTPNGQLRDPLNARLFLEPEVSIRWKINDLFEILVNIGSIDEAWKQMEDTIEDILNREFAKRSTSEVLAEVGDIKTAIHTELSRKTKLWGIEIIDVNMKTPDTSHGVNRSIRDNVVVENVARQSTVTARADKENIRLRGEGEGAAIHARELAHGTGIRAAADALGVKPEMLLAARTAEGIMKDGSKFVLGADGITNAVAAGAKALDALTNTKRAP